ncbi:gastrin/cholecystokinin-like peptide [Hemicordylus capensis]|uniref:gastrin/cholecystokinin-like peptide n=1 Tax=Hemicordylus capensis TaxID=884348 RepID=UPI002304A220|nr:gastrin/cholecystokinin-like peptide [Hemicordylus capensis]XP_053115334.1 gastrin/cholecystokinin-like peptide [Hemicordylus capensis]
MHSKVFACLLLATLLGTTLTRSYQLDGRIRKQVKAALGPDRMQRSGNEVLVRRDWPEGLSQAQKNLISQILPGIYPAEFAGKVSHLQTDNTHYPAWMDFGRRSSEDVNEDA